MMLLESGCSDCLRRQSRTRHDGRRAARACFSCNEISVAATSRLPLETRIAFFWRNGRKKCTHFLPFLSVFFSPQIPQEGAIFSRAPFWLILRLVRPRPSNLHFPFFRVSFSCFSPLWRCDAFRLSSLDAQLQRTIIVATQSCLCFTTVSHEAVCWRHLHRSPLRFPSRIVPRLLPLLHSVRFSRSSRPLVISHSNAPPFPEASRAAAAPALGLVISPPPVK